MEWQSGWEAARIEGLNLDNDFEREKKGRSFRGTNEGTGGRPQVPVLNDEI